MALTTHYQITPPDRYAYVRDLTRRALIHAAARQRPRIESVTEFRRPLRGVCRAAREHGVRVEHLLVILKQCWWQLAETQMLERTNSEERLNGLVTLCIKEYYRSDSND